MPKPAVLLVTGMVLGTGLGFLFAAATGSGTPPALDAVHDHSAHDHGGGEHAQLTEAGNPAPTLTLTLHPDGAQSRNLHIGVTSFSFAPEAVNGPHVAGLSGGHG